MQGLSVQAVRFEFPTEPLDLAIPVKLTVKEPGPYFIEVWIEGRLIGRRPILFGELPTDFDLGDEGAIRACLAKLDTERTELEDPELTDDVCFLDYFSICQRCHSERDVLRFEGEPLAVYWDQYPLQYKAFLALSVRLPRGEHAVRVDLVHISTRLATPIETATVVSDSSMVSTRIHGETILQVPEPGFYFINAYVNDKRVASRLLSAETARAQYSYGLLPEHRAQVESGEFLVLLRGAQMPDPSPG